MKTKSFDPLHKKLEPADMSLRDKLTELPRLIKAVMR
jgi:hypothetical protein